MIKTIGENIIFKLTVKKITKSGLVIERESKMADKFFIDEAEVFQVGDKIKSVNQGQKVILSGRPMYPLDIKQFIGDESDDNVMYSKGKEEDIVAVIE